MKLKLFFVLACASATAFAQLTQTVTVPLGGNAYIEHQDDAKLTQRGIEQWKSSTAYIKVYVRLAKIGDLTLSLGDLTKIEGDNQLSVGIKNQFKTIQVRQDAAHQLKVGTWKITDTGYLVIEIKGLNKSGAYYPNMGTLELSGSAIDENTKFVKNNEGNFFYWGRRGPSVHLGYQMPEKTEVEWFYNELTVPKGEDVIGSYYMANGFAGGYFGIQVNSATERRILFSVWSPFNTDNPKEIPASHQIKLLKKGKEVHTGEFGNEGAGGQSFLRYQWKAGNTYRFLLRAEPVADNYTNYTAYFFAPELGQWQLVASFSRPQTHTYLKGIHSFLENFSPNQGDKQRKVLFNNQWVCDSKGNWTELNTARFTIDNTGAQGYRLDYAGGVDGKYFFLKNCGFFSQNVKAKTLFTRPLGKEKPQIDFNVLP
jgi:DUF2075 family protein